MKQSFPEDIRKPGLKTRMLQRVGMFNSRNLFWSWYEPRNFGDWLGPYLFRKISGRDPIYCTPSHGPPKQVHFSVGSILRRLSRDDVAVVWGSGVISRTDTFRRPKRILAVRGPFSRERCLELGYDCPPVYGDPAILLPLFFDAGRDERNPVRMAVIPHFLDYPLAMERYEGLDGVRVVDVCQPVEKVLSQIASCEAAVSSSLHGLIVSQAYGLPAAWLEFSNNLDGDGIKFRDYYSSMGVSDPGGPIRPPATCHLEDFQRMVEDAPKATPTGLAQPLLEACPYWKPQSD